MIFFWACLELYNEAKVWAKEGLVSEHVCGKTKFEYKKRLSPGYLVILKRLDKKYYSSRLPRVLRYMLLILFTGTNFVV